LDGGGVEVKVLGETPCGARSAWIVDGDQPFQSPSSTSASASDDLVEIGAGLVRVALDFKAGLLQALRQF